MIRTADEAIEELDARLRTAVTRLTRVVARPAVLMSASVDSPLVAAHVKAVTGSLDALTMSMPWPPDETEIAAAITRQLGGVHHACRFGVQDIDVVADLDAFVQAMEEPIAFGLGMLMTRLAAQASRSRRIMCGVAPDLLFGEPARDRTCRTATRSIATCSATSRPITWRRWCICGARIPTRSCRVCGAGWRAIRRGGICASRCCCRVDC